MMDFHNVKKITIDAGDVKQIAINGVVVWSGYTNQVPISTDTDGSIYNGIGYKDNARLSSSGSVSGSAQSNSVVTGFIPFPDGDKTVVRMSGVDWLSESGRHYYIHLYDESKKFLAGFDAATWANGTYDHVVTITKDANGVITIKFSETYGDTNTLLNYVRNKAKYIRLNAMGSGANMILTINEEI